MAKNLERQMFIGVMAIGALALLMLTACKPETGLSPVATPALERDSAFTNLRPTPLPVTPWPTATPLPDRGVRMSMPVEVHPALEQQWKHLASLALDNRTLITSIDDGTGKRLPVTVDLDTQQVQVLDQNLNQAQIQNLHIFGRYAMWTASQDRQSSLFVRDLQADQTSRVTEGAYNVAFSGNIAVWEQIGNGWDIWGYDMTQDKTFPIVTRKDSQTSPLVSGRWVVYRDAADKDDIGIGLYTINLDTGEDIRLGSVYASSSQYVPPLYAIDAPWVAWSTGQGSKTSDLHFYNLDTQTSLTVTVPSCELAVPDTPLQLGRPEHLVLSGSMLFFRGCWQDLGYDIDRKVFFSLPTNTSEMQGGSWAGWAISGDQLVWTRISGPYGQEESHIYTAKIIRDK
jgi:hypothetical protein